MFFKLHSEGKIGYKKLTNPDLGLKGSSHQSHIGLYDDILTFLPNQNFEDLGMFIYNNKVETLGFTFGRIQNPNGTFRSPNLKTGGRDVVSIVSVIRQSAKEVNQDLDWHLIWFGLQSEEVVFYLFNEQSSDFVDISNIIDLTKSGRIEKGEHSFDQLLIYLEQKVNVSGKPIIEDLEIASQLGISKKYRPFDLENANTLFKETGKRGEEIIANFLDYQKSRNQIFNYIWYNKSMETGLPYDFSIQQNNQNVIFIDVKSTNFKFEQPLIFSNQEIDCIAQNQNYHIYRVFDLLGDETPKLRICENSRTLASLIQPHILHFNSSLNQQQVLLQMAKMVIKPTNELLAFNNEISLINNT
ncbi:MAG: DUF3883 domain-containing protein [Pedobacter sp.]|uniref:DUF3883 domain-containing protein n=1 Tax=Pedobacter sp. TaxID=1411316 RepID=UPI0028080185|nr:DUF3883 domain-containing protein [Pedobacter sp.]MDQ8004563.1 DUF3883 domain-containing protein [Pedobacter sp.]